VHLQAISTGPLYNNRNRMAGRGGGGGWADERRWSVVHRSALVCQPGVRGIHVYPGTQLRWRHKSFVGNDAFRRSAGRRLFIVRVGLLPSAQFYRNLRYTLTINNCKYWLLVIGTLEIAYFGTWINVFILWPADKLPPLTSGAWFCRKFCNLYASIYGKSTTHSSN